MLHRLASKIVLQIGAHDGGINDPLTKYAISHPRFQLILVEPQPDVQTRLRERYKLRQNTHFVSAAVGNAAEDMELYRIRPGACAAESVSGMASLDLNRLLPVVRRYGLRRSDIQAITVPVLTFSDLCRECNISRLDAVQIDAEGWDGKIMKELLMTNFRPAVINFEHCYLPVGEKRELAAILRENGYLWLGTGMDTVAVAIKDFEALRERRMDPS